MANLERLKEWRGNVDWNSGFYTAMQDHHYVWMKKLHTAAHIDPNLHTSSYIAGFKAGIKQYRMERLLKGG